MSYIAQEMKIDPRLYLIKDEIFLIYQSESRGCIYDFFSISEYKAMSVACDNSHYIHYINTATAGELCSYASRVE